MRAMWPRSGGDRGNRGVMPVVGPALRRVAHAISLAAPPGPAVTMATAGGATAADGSLRVVARGRLFAIDPDARVVRWSCDLRELAGEGNLAPGTYAPAEPARQGSGVAPRMTASLPTILDGDRTLLTVAGDALVVGAGGDVMDRVEVPMVDDSGLAPNVDLEGRPILTTILGEVHVWHADGLRTASTNFGYDLVPVAVYADGTFAIAGYSGTGLCRAASDGRVVWRSDLRDADLVPTVSRAQHAAAGSLNARRSAIFDADGRRIATYAAVATFAEYEVDRGWIAQGERSLARLTATGEVRWRHDLGATEELRWGRTQPLVDADGTIYVATAGGVAAFDGAGVQRAALSLGGSARPWPVRAGVLAAVVGDELLLIE